MSYFKLYDIHKNLVETYGKDIPKSKLRHF